MLKQIRKGLSSVLVLALLGVLIASFALWGVGDIFVQSPGVVAQVGDEIVSTPEFRRSFQNEIQRYNEQLDAGLDTQRAVAMGLDDVVLGQLIQRASLDHEAKNLGLWGSDNEVQEAIMQMEAFHDISGNFSRFAYDQQIQYAGYTAREFEDEIRVDIARSQLIDSITETALFPDVLFETIYAYTKEQRRARIATIPASAVTNIPAPDEQTLKVFYEANIDDFQTPEYRAVNFLILQPSDFAERVELSEAELREEYEVRFDEFNTPAQRGVEVAILGEEEEARELYDRVQSGEDFATVAAELTGFTEEELDQGLLSYYEVEQNYGEVAAERVFNTPVGEITQPSASLLAWQVFRVTGIREGEEKPFEDVRQELEQKLAEERGIDALYDTAAVVDDEISAGSTVPEIAEAIGMDAVILDAVSVEGRKRDGTIVEATEVLPYLPEAFQLEVNNELFLEEGENETFYLTSVQNVFPPEPIPFEEVEERVRATWYAQEQVRRAGERANQALELARGGESLETIAARYGGTVFQTGMLQRDRAFTGQEIDPNIARLMFSLTDGEFGIERESRGDGYVLLEVTEVVPGDPTFNRAAYLQMRGLVRNDMRNDFFIQFQKAIQNDLNVDINQDLLENLFSPDGQQTIQSPF